MLLQHSHTFVAVTNKIAVHATTQIFVVSDAAESWRLSRKPHFTSPQKLHLGWPQIAMRAHAHTHTHIQVLDYTCT